MASTQWSKQQQQQQSQQQQSRNAIRRKESDLRSNQTISADCLQLAIVVSILLHDEKYNHKKKSKIT
jgi:hypothetical protein